MKFEEKRAREKAIINTHLNFLKNHNIIFKYIEDWSNQINVNFKSIKF